MIQGDEDEKFIPMERATGYANPSEETGMITLRFNRTSMT